MFLTFIITRIKQNIDADTRGAHHPISLKDPREPPRGVSPHHLITEANRLTTNRPPTTPMTITSPNHIKYPRTTDLPPVQYDFGEGTSDSSGISIEVMRLVGSDTPDAISMSGDGESPTVGLQSPFTTTNFQVTDVGSSNDTIQVVLITVVEFEEIQLRSDVAGSTRSVDDDIGVLSRGLDITPRTDGSKITNSHVLGSNTWSFVIFDGVSWVLVPRVCGGVYYE